MRADRSPTARSWSPRTGADDGYDTVRGRDWDAVIEVSWQPGMVRGALTALGERAAHWTYVSSGSVYASHAVIGADESGPLLARTTATRRTSSITARRRWRASRRRPPWSAAASWSRAPGLIGGPGDHSGRSGYWVARAARDPRGPMLVPATPDMPTQVVDAARPGRVAAGLARRPGLTGTFDAVGPVVPFGRWIKQARRLGGHTGPVVQADPAWLPGQGVAEYMGPESLPMWVAEPGWEGFSARSGARRRGRGAAAPARAPELQADVLAWEREQGLDRSRRAGLSAERERELLGSTRAGRRERLAHRRRAHRARPHRHQARAHSPDPVRGERPAAALRIAVLDRYRRAS